jgi:hypothetical protein
LPPPPPLAPGLDSQQRALADQASDMIAQGRAEDAQVMLDAHLSRNTYDAYATLPVLRRLAARMSTQPTRSLLASPEHSDRRNTFELLELYWLGFGYGLGTGIFVDVQAEVENLRGAVWLPVLFAGGGIAAAYLIDHGHPIRRGRASSANTGMLLGLGFAAALAGQIDEDLSRARPFDCGWGASTTCDWRDYDLSSKEVASIAWLGATIGLGAGLGLGVLTDATPGDASFVFAGGVWGSALGLLANAAGESDDGYGLAAMIGMGIGATGTAIGAHFLRPSESQVRWTNLGAVAGSLLGAAVGVLPDTRLRDPTLFCMAISAGILGGGIAGFVLGRPSQSTPTSMPLARVDRFRAEPSVSPVAGGAVMQLNFPHLL